MEALAVPRGLPHTTSSDPSLVALTTGEDLEVALIQSGDAPYVRALASMQLEAEARP